MAQEIEKKIEEYKEKFALSTAKKIFKDTDEIKAELVFYKTVLSWLADIKTDSEFIDKFFHFNSIKELIYQHDMFSNIKKIDKGKNEELINKCIEDFYKIKNNENYDKLSSKAGYSLPDSFSIYENYINNSLKSKVAFFEKFNNEIEEISLNMSKNKTEGEGENLYVK